MSNSSSTATPASGQELAYSGEITVVFRNNTYQFVILREFALPAGAPLSDLELVAGAVGPAQPATSNTPTAAHPIRRRRRRL
jgi:hypothetical protein